MRTRLTINGTGHDLDVEPATLLVDLLRDGLGLTGTHVGCDTSQCGACNVLIDGQPVKACTVLAVQLDGAGVTTIEGLAGNGGLPPVQAAVKEPHGLQCGVRPPGLGSARNRIARRHGPGVSRETIAHELEGNLCRCTGYQNIVSAIEAGAKAMADA